MSDKNQELIARLLVIFRSEATEQVQAMSSSLLLLEGLPAEGAHYQDTIETIFRQAHSLKGAARAVKFTPIELLCQPLESILSALRDKSLLLSTALVDLLHQAIKLIADLTPLSLEEARTHQPRVSMMVRQLERALASPDENKQIPAQSLPPVSPSLALTTSAVISTELSSTESSHQQNPDVAPAHPRSSKVISTVRIATAKLDAVMRLAEEMLTPRLALEQRVTELQQVADDIGVWRKQSKELQRLLSPLQRELEQQDNPTLRKLLDYVADEQVRMRALQDQVTTTLRATANDRRTLAAMTENLQHRVKDMQLLPCAPLLEAFALQARELAREQDKNVVVTTQGGNIEVDRRLLEEIKDPLIHLARNCIDHGIEKSDERHRLKKSSSGNINVAIAQRDSNKITLTITDDGAGIDADQLVSSALARGLITAEEAKDLSKTAAMELMFRSGLSTSKLITDVSGRGLGMAIVKEKIEQLGGNIAIASEAGQGTTFTIVLPINLATFRGLLVTVAEQTFILPSVYVDCALRIATEDIHHINLGHTVNVHGQAMALVWLHDFLSRPRSSVDDSESVLAVVLGRGDQRVAFRVDEVLGEQEVLVKGLGPQLRRVRNISGASVLGNGTVAAVLNVVDLLDAAAHPLQLTPPVAAPAASRQQSILVVEDSITSRSLMKNILETAGYQVVTAVDGIDAYTTLKTQPFDLVVSDVDMPRMNGFDLTAKLRADNQLAEIPVILVTTLDSREDRERGVDAGANAYIVKSSFDQNNLLEVIQRLI